MGRLIRMYHQPDGVSVLPTRCQLEPAMRRSPPSGSEPKKNRQNGEAASTMGEFRRRVTSAATALYSGTLALGDQARVEKVPHLHPQARLDEDLCQLEQRYDDKKSRVHGRVEQERDRDRPRHAWPLIVDRITSGSQVRTTSNVTFKSRRAGVGGSNPSRFATSVGKPTPGKHAGLQVRIWRICRHGARSAIFCRRHDRSPRTGSVPCLHASKTQMIARAREFPLAAACRSCSACNNVRCKETIRRDAPVCARRFGRVEAVLGPLGLRTTLPSASGRGTLEVDIRAVPV